MSDNDPLDDAVQGWLINQQSLFTEDYLKRGRQFKEKEIGFLKERWVERMRESFNHDRTNIQERDDVQAEILLRGEEPPTEMIAKEMKAFGERLGAEMERMEKEEPGWLEEMERDLNIEVADFLRQLKEPSN